MNKDTNLAPPNINNLSTIKVLFYFISNICGPYVW